MAAPVHAPPDYFLVSRGMNFPKHADFIQGRTRARLRRGVYEAGEAEAVLRTVRPGDVVLELGAGLGFISTLMVLKRRVAEVHSVEPNPHLIPYIQTVHAANAITNTTLRNGILGPKAGERDFFLRPDLVQSSLRLEADEVDLPKTRIPVLEAAPLVAEIKPTVLYCNLNGEEAAVLPHLPMAGLRAAVISLTPGRLGQGGMNALFSALMQAGLSYQPRGSAGRVLCWRREESL